MADLGLNNLLTIGATAPTYVAATATTGDRAYNPRGRTRVWVVNDGASVTCTIKSHRDSNFGPYPDKTLTIPANTFYPLPPFDTRRFNSADGYITIIFSSVTDVTIAAVEDETIYKDS
jgi:hypothetical protein